MMIIGMTFAVVAALMAEVVTINNKMNLAK